MDKPVVNSLIAKKVHISGTEKVEYGIIDCFHVPLRQCYNISQRYGLIIFRLFMSGIPILHDFSSVRDVLTMEIF